jgi:hypothetical protein
MSKQKRRLTKQELNWVRQVMEEAPQGHKPSLRNLAHRLGVNQPSLVKSLGGWKGNERDRPIPFKPELVQPYNPGDPLVKIEPATTKVPELGDVHV